MLPLVMSRTDQFFYARAETCTIHKVRWQDDNVRRNPNGIIVWAEKDGIECRVHLCAHNPCRANFSHHPSKYLPHPPPEHLQFVSFVPHVHEGDELLYFRGDDYRSGGTR